jgi:hypothetical protein
LTLTGIGTGSSLHGAAEQSSASLNSFSIHGDWRNSLIRICPLPPL